MKKFIVLFILAIGLIFTPTVNQTVFAVNSPQNVRVIAPTYVYKSPDIKSEIYKHQNSDYVVLAVGTILQVDNSSQEDYKLFYKVFVYGVIDGAIEDEIAYVLKAHTLDSQITSPEKKLDTNASIKTDNATIYSYDYTTQTYTQLTQKLTKDTQVRILDGYDKAKEYTYISYQDANNEIISCYIKTADLFVKGVNYSLIVGISTLITCVSVVAIVFGFKAKKKKK